MTGSCNIVKCRSLHYHCEECDIIIVKAYDDTSRVVDLLFLSGINFQLFQSENTIDTITLGLSNSDSIICFLQA